MDPITIAMGLAQFAPQIVRWLSGSDKAAEVAQNVVEIAESVTGRQGPDALAAITADPTIALQFRQSVMQHEAAMDQMYLVDRQSARSRDVALAQAGHVNQRANFMVAGAVVGLLSCLAVLVFLKGTLPGEVVGIVSTVAGLFGACLRDAFQFEFGSSRSSSVKDATISNLTRGG